MRQNKHVLENGIATDQKCREVNLQRISKMWLAERKKINITRPHTINESVAEMKE